MNQSELVTKQPLGLSGRLRAATAAAHARLEAELDILHPPVRQDRLTELLERFYGFHLVWEPAVAAVPGLTMLMARRARLDHLRADLQALGASVGRIDSAPRCTEAAALAHCPARALGSIYVMEGSTLGGQVIGRRLRSAAWLPARGVSYFDPYGARTGAMWRAFKASVELVCPPGAEASVEAGAIETFDLLRLWLTGAGA